LGDRGGRGEGGEARGPALTKKEKLAAEFPAVPQDRSDLAQSHFKRGVLLADLGKREEAEKAYREAFSFSSRRRHTRRGRDWSSDVCSSDLSIRGQLGLIRTLRGLTANFGCFDDEQF